MLPKFFDAVRQMAQEHSLIEPTKTQARLSDNFIAPIREKLIADLVRIRREFIDPEARKNFRKSDTRGSEEYPIGFCGPIRDVVMEILRHRFKKEASSIPGLFPYQMKLRKIWCMTGIPSFQNAIQVGNHIIDAATDTIDPYRYPVKIATIENAGLRNPRDHEDICHTIESYWGVDCYPNIYFPRLAPFFPVIGISKKGRVGFMCTNMRHTDAKNLVGGDFSSARRFIFDSYFSHKRLREEHLESLYWIPPIGKDYDITFQASEKPSPHKVEKIFAHARKYSPEILAQVFLRNFYLLKGSALDIH